MFDESDHELTRPPFAILCARRSEQPDVLSSTSDSGQSEDWDQDRWPI